MIKKVKNDFRTNFKFYAILLVIFLVFVINFDYYIYSPGGLISLDKRINVENAYDYDGSFNLTYVTSRRASLANILLSYIIPDWDMEKIDKSRIENESASEIFNRDKIYLKETSYDAIIAAFKEANIEYSIDSIDVTVTHVYEAAKTDIKTSDIIKSINGNPINSFNDLTTELDKYQVGEKINISVMRNNKLIECTSELVSINDKSAIGVALAEIKSITTNPKVDFVFKRNESGSSRGLMSALDIYNKITEYDITKGRIISGTGSINENGVVGSISGVKYKLIGAVNKHADIFLVPSENYEEAIRLKNERNLKIEIIEADNLHNVIEKLK